MRWPWQRDPAPRARRKPRHRVRGIEVKPGPNADNEGLDLVTTSALLRGVKDDSLALLSYDRYVYFGLERSRRRLRREFFLSDYCRRAVEALQHQVIGPSGIGLQSTPEAEAAWAEWCDSCDATGRRTLADVLHAVMHGLLIDGEAFIMLTRSGGDLRLRMRPTEDVPVQHLQWGKTDDNPIIMGVEVDRETRRPIAYWFDTLSRDTELTPHYVGRPQRPPNERVPADQVLHVFRRKFPVQTRGLPWLTTIAGRLGNLREYETAELEHAKRMAKPAGFITTDGSVPTGGLETLPADGTEVGDDDNPYPTLDIQAGDFIGLGEGQGVMFADPKHPTDVYSSFVVQQLRGIAAGAGLPYHMIAEDWGSVNFSAARSAMITHKPGWESIQQLLIQQICEPVFMAWVDSAAAKYGFRRDVEHAWVPRKWEHIQPREEAQAQKVMLECATTSRQEIIRNRGGDPQEIMSEWLAEQEILSEVMDDGGDEPDPGDERDAGDDAGDERGSGERILRAI